MANISAMPQSKSNDHELEVCELRWSTVACFARRSFSKKHGPEIILIDVRIGRIYYILIRFELKERGRKVLQSASWCKLCLSVCDLCQRSYWRLQWFCTDWNRFLRTFLLKACCLICIATKAVWLEIVKDVLYCIFVCSPRLICINYLGTRNLNFRLRVPRKFMHLASISFKWSECSDGFLTCWKWDLPMTSYSL